MSVFPDRFATGRAALVCGALALGGAALLAEQQNGPGLAPMAVQLGSIEVSAPNGCVVGYRVSVVTSVGPEPETFEIQVADDGRITQIVPLSAPADGGVHVLEGAFGLVGFPGTETPGIGIYLVDDGLILDAVDPFGLPCSAPDVPALEGSGYLALGGVLALVGLIALRRTRRRVRDAGLPN